MLKKRRKKKTNLYELSSLSTILAFPASIMTLAATMEPFHIALWITPNAPFPMTVSKCNFSESGKIHITL